MDKDTLVRKIRQKGLTLREVARRMGMSEQALGARVRAKAISCDTLERMAEVMGESVSYFYNECPIFSIEDADEIASLRAKLQAVERMIREGRLSQSPGSKLFGQ